MTDKIKPRLTSEAEKELQKTEKQLDAFNEQVKSLTLDEMNKVPVKEVENQISQEDLKAHGETWLKPTKILGPGSNAKTGFVEKFNENFRKEYEYQKQYVAFTAYNNMISGDLIELWTKPFPGTNCEFWQVPANKPVWGPRYLAEQITRARYHILTMKATAENPFDGNVTDRGHYGEVQGTLVAKETVQRLDAKPYKRKTSLFMGSQF